MEETGFDVSELLDKDEYLEVIFGQQRVRLYIIAGVSDDTSFAPLTKKEISVGVSFPFYFFIFLEIYCYFDSQNVVKHGNVSKCKRLSGSYIINILVFYSYQSV